MTCICGFNAEQDKWNLVKIYEGQNNLAYFELYSDAYNDKRDIIQPINLYACPNCGNIYTHVKTR